MFSRRRRKILNFEFPFAHARNPTDTHILMGKRRNGTDFSRVTNAYPTHNFCVFDASRRTCKSREFSIYIKCFLSRTSEVIRRWRGLSRGWFCEYFLSPKWGENWMCRVCFWSTEEVLLFSLVFFPEFERLPGFRPFNNFYYLKLRRTQILWRRSKNDGFIVAEKLPRTRVWKSKVLRYLCIRISNIMQWRVKILDKCKAIAVVIRKCLAREKL